MHGSNPLRTRGTALGSLFKNPKQVVLRLGNDFRTVHALSFLFVFVSSFTTDLLSHVAGNDWKSKLVTNLIALLL